MSAPTARHHRWRRIFTFVTALTVSVAVTGLVSFAAARAVPADQSWSVSAYLVPWDEDRGMQALTEAAGALTSVSPVWYTPDDDGQLLRTDDTDTRRVADRARELGLDVIPSISNFRDGRWDAALARRLVSDPELRRAHVTAIVVVAEGWDGIDIDYESLAANDRAVLVVFLSELGGALDVVNKRLTVAVQAATVETTLERAEFYRGVAAAADEVRVMAYDLSWNGSEPGPIAPVSWVEDVIEFTTAHVPREKITLGLPAHGHDWPDGATATDLTFADASALADEHERALKWNTDAQAPWFAYTADATNHTVWFEDAPSLAAKLSAAVDHKLGGVFLWRLGGEDPEIWPILAANRPNVE